MAKRGPNTERGKAASSRNATRHGILSISPVVEGESEEEWERHLQGMIESLEPDSWHETVIAERIALILWRLRRVTLAEMAEVLFSQSSTEEDLAVTGAYAQRTLSKGILPRIPEIRVEAEKYRRLLPGRLDFEKFVRYEAHLHRLYLQNLHELEALQTRRQGGQAPLARLDISGPPAA